ncbi:hypothetical protein C8J56DRAFT_1028097 [Mycena floridula]|nr:hypothetical protein C8J56DRAFT_1028097 [Mycena floridula]
MKWEERDERCNKKRENHPRSSSSKPLSPLELQIGATGEGVALDAVTRQMGGDGDISDVVSSSQGTSSKSTKLVRGGVQKAVMEWKFVREAFFERATFLHIALYLSAFGSVLYCVLILFVQIVWFGQMGARFGQIFLRFHSSVQFFQIFGLTIRLQ